MENYIHVNCDLGEGGKFDAELMPLISACNIACGGHAGNLETMQHSVRLAMKHGTEIGAHPSYPDKENFGRKSLSMTAEDLKLSVEAQVMSLLQIVEAEGGKLTHIKLHGALYNDAAKDENIAKIVLESFRLLEHDFRLYVPANSVIQELAMGEFDCYVEAFADRNYEPDYSLVARSKPDAIIADRELVFEHVHEIYAHQKVRAVNGEILELEADTFCLHSDTPSSVEILKYLHKKFAENHLKIQH
ncbi:MAG: lactam utilization protein LamB [Gramella sp.]|nr:lactam utilization protein LamB [Christiangramia sp.]|tara:strand:+ start:292 stop:1029 length:738 start_codon:yes stop_codon:yes gene_type:complete